FDLSPHFSISANKIPNKQIIQTNKSKGKNQKLRELCLKSSPLPSPLPGDWRGWQKRMKREKF
ncbi:MAG: hypothetical protein M1536_05580, partial [Firmicutes bacterium]|nr:hypothetical protein [Bacillota bacterium]